MLKEISVLETDIPIFCTLGTLEGCCLNIICLISVVLVGADNI